MASQEDLRNVYSRKATPRMFGGHFNERPQPDALGRLKATPLEIQRAMMGEFGQELDVFPAQQRSRKKRTKSRK